MSFPSKLLNPGEDVVVHTRTHVKSLILPALAVLAAVAVATWFTTMIDHTAVRIGLWVAVGLVLLWFVCGPLLQWLTRTYTVTNRRLISRAGVVSKEGRTIPLNRISGVDFEIGVVDRIFGCGTLVIADASTDGRVELEDIPRVEQVQLQVADLLHRLHESGSSDGL